VNAKVASLLTNLRAEPVDKRQRVYPKVKSEIRLGVAWSQTSDSVPEYDGLITFGKEVGRESRVREIVKHGSTSGGRKRRRWPA
jgi:hypothetical protein